jgi:hypothetical protein
VRNGHIRPKAGDRSGEGGRGVPLYDQQVGLTIQCGTERLDELRDMFVRVGSSRAIKPLAVERAQAEIIEFERMLSGENDPGFGAARPQRSGDGLQLDGFGPGADDQTNIGETQPSP